MIDQTSKPQPQKITKRNVTFPCGNLSLEGILHTFEEAEPRPAVVVCHPHPLYGGSLHNSVVVAVCQELANSGIIALRFNFRGVEGSQGMHGDGVAELEDVRAALDFITSLPNSERGASREKGRLGVAGYSFGCYVGLREAFDDPRVCAVAGISPALSVNDFSFLEDFNGPKLLLAGELDEFVPREEFRRLVERLPEPKEFELTPFADHFWVGFERRVGIRVATFFADAFGLGEKAIVPTPMC